MNDFDVFISYSRKDMWLEIKQRPHSYAITASGDIIAAVANCIFCGGWTEVNIGTLIVMLICMSIHWCFLNTTSNPQPPS